VHSTGSGLFADASRFEERFIADYDQITAKVDALREHLGMNIVLTSGSFDILHEGHSMYLEAARGFGDFLIVGVDSDEKVRRRKGPTRPAVPEKERLRMVTHQRGVGLVTLKPADAPRWALIKAVRPDVLVTTAETYAPEEIAELEAEWCGRVQVLDRMADVSTSARLRRLQLQLADVLSEHLAKRLPEVLQDIIDEVVGTGEGEGEGQRAGGRGSAGEGERQRAGGRGSAGEGERQRAGGRGSM
jgi:rfaE bifunctional protein nucleotidyltransferase chain/domain